MVSPAQASRRLLDVAVAVFGSQGGALDLDGHGRRRLTYKAGAWSGEPAIEVPLAAGGRLYGRLALGRRTNEATYTAEDGELLARTAGAAAATFPASANARPPSSKR